MNLKTLICAFLIGLAACPLVSTEHEYLNGSYIDDDYLLQNVEIFERDDDYERGGVIAQISQEGLDFITQVAQKAIPHLVKHTKIPESEAGGYKLKKLDIEEFAAPNISAKFVKDVGIRAEIHLPKALITGTYEGGFGFWTKTGKFKGQVTDLNLTMLVGFRLNETNRKVEVLVHECRGGTADVTVVFGGGWSSVLNALRGVVATFLTQQLDEILCQVTVMSTKMISEEIGRREQSLETDFDEMAENYKTADADVFCGDPTQGQPGAGGGNASRKLSDFAIDFNLFSQPVFTDSHALVAFNGGLLFKSSPAASAHRGRAPGIPWSERMVSFVVTEFVPNSFFAHVFDQGLGDVTKIGRVSDLPPVLRHGIQLLCSSCQVRLTASLESAPTITTTEKEGVTLYFHGQFRLTVDGSFREFDIINGDSGVTVSIKPYVKSGVLYGKVDVDSVNIQIEEAHLGGTIGKAVSGAGKIMKKLLPKKLWPSIQRRLSFALNRKGFKLPVICGLELLNTHVTYIDHAVVIDTDIDYNLDKFYRLVMEIPAE